MRESVRESRWARVYPQQQTECRWHWQWARTCAAHFHAQRGACTTGHKFDNEATGNRPTAGARTQRALPRGDAPLQLYSLAPPNGQKVRASQQIAAAGHNVPTIFLRPRISGSHSVPIRCRPPYLGVGPVCPEPVNRSDSVAR